MKTNLISDKVTIAVLLSVLFLLGIPVFGMSGGPFEITWSTIDGGGQTSTGGSFSLTGTIGQADAGMMSGGGYDLLGGFWSGLPICIVDFHLYAIFAEYWLETGSDLPADLYQDDIIDEYDLELFVDEWLDYCPYDWPLK
jgi:hypothetical protein